MLAKRVRELADDYVAAHEQTFDPISDNSLEALARWHASEDGWVAELDSVDPSLLVGLPEWVLYGYLRYKLDASRATRVCRSELWPAHQYGWQWWLVTFYLEPQPVETPELRQQALARWRRLPDYLRIEVENLREGMRLGATVPRRNVDLAVEQINALLEAQPAVSQLYAPARKSNDPEFREQWTALVVEELLPAIQQYRDFLRDEYHDRARTSLGLVGMPNGAACYRAKLKQFTTTDVDPRDLYRLGQARVREQQAKTQKLAQSVLGSGATDMRSIKARLDELPENRLESSEQVLSIVSDALARAKQAAPFWFEQLPEADVEIVPYTAAEARIYRTAQYQDRSSDGSQRARFRIDTTHLNAQRRQDLEHTAFHETVPGHHLQTVLSRGGA